MAHEFHVPNIGTTLIACDGLQNNFVLFQRSDCDWAGVSLIVAEILLFGFQST